MKKSLVRVAVSCVTALSLLLASCGRAPQNGQTTTVDKQQKDRVQIAVTNQLLSMNPIISDASEVMKYAVGLSFLPLVELDADKNMELLLLESIETQDNKVYKLKLREGLKWSDGQPLSTEDVAFTLEKITSAVISNPAMSIWGALEGLDDATATHPDDQPVSGIKVLSPTEMELHFKSPVGKLTLESSLLRYLNPVPKHLLGKMSTEELKTTDWFNKPEVVSGPYIPQEVDPSHYVSYTANKNYWKGEPKIKTLNIRIYSDASGLLAGLQSGEVDFVQPTMASFPQDDVASLAKIDRVEVSYDKPLTNQLLFFNTRNVTDARVRQAMAYAIDRESLVKQLLGGQGQVTDGFINAGSLFNGKKDEKALPYNPDKAKELLQAAAWKQDKALVFKINAGDSGMTLAADIIASQLAAVGIQVQVQKVDFNNLLTAANKHDFDMLAVQYTLSPTDPFPDVQYLVSGEDNWTGYHSEALDKLLPTVQAADESNLDEVRGVYAQIDKIMQEDMPLINLYVLSNPGVHAKALKGAKSSIYGFFNNVHEWSWD